MFNTKRKGNRRSQALDSGESSQSAPPPIPLPSSKTDLDLGSIRRASESSAASSQWPSTNDERQEYFPAGVQASSTITLPEISKNRRGDPLGLFIIYEPETPPPLDIIFVHGLGGTSRATWSKGPEIEYFWPQKWLPREPGICSARILSFGYNANWSATGPAPITGIADFAKDLLYSMKTAMDERSPKELEIGQRPVIFVSHSMGGLVVKQAYILGQNDEQYSTIVSSISAVIFLATPHRGSNMADILNKILSVSFLGHSQKQYISELKNGSLTIKALNEQFRHIAPKLDIFSFYETLQTSMGVKTAMVVEKDSAILGYPGEISSSLNANHRNICKFDSPQDSNYRSVRNALRTLVAAICRKGNKLLGAQGKTQTQQLETLLAVSENHKDDLEFFHKRQAKGTCEWILFEPSFKDWAHESDGPTMLWLHALPASGKSILSSFIVNHMLKESFCVYYFFRFDDESKRSLSICLRTIAFQIAEQLPSFHRALTDRFPTKTFEKVDVKTIWEQVFVNILFKMRFEMPIYFVIDALDESDNPQLLVETMKSLLASSTHIKVLLVSRQTPELISICDHISTVAPAVYLPLEKTKRDIRIYVENEVLQSMYGSSEFKSQIIGRLVAGANGNFLWASLALVEVMMCNTQEDLDETIEGIPSGMDQLYQRMENSIIEKNPKPRDRKLGQMILTWAICSRLPLSLKELEQALPPEFSIVYDPKFTINRVCGQFVVVDSTGRLVMVHQTARDHIIATNSQLGVDIKKGHEKLFEKCMLALIALDQHRDFDRRSGGIHNILGNREFVHYAMTSWAYHLNMISSESNVPLLLLTDFLKGDSCSAWIALLAQENQLKLLASSSKIMSMYVRRKSSLYAKTNPLLHRLDALDLVESWATDFLKILGKFGRNLTVSPLSIYHQIPPFCPKNSIIYRQFEQKAKIPCALSVEGLSETTWDDSLAKLSLGPESQALIIACFGDHFAIVTGQQQVFLYDSTTFEVERVLDHGEQIGAMNFSSSTKLLVTYGFRTTKIWFVNTGLVMHRIPNPPKTNALTIAFSAKDSQLIIASSDRYTRIVTLAEPNPLWSILHPELLRSDTALDRRVHNVPWRAAFNSDGSCIAVAYRGSPLCVWSLDPPELIGRCMRSQAYAGNAWTVVDQVLWHPNSEEIIGLYMGGQVFRWNPYTNVQQELQAEGSILASSPGGKFFAIGDSHGTIKLYNFDHFSLIYQLSCENMINDICFSPDSKRLYDLRGQFCNVWEPNVLIRLDELIEHDKEAGSDATSIQTIAVSEVVAEVRDPITAISTQFGGHYQALGNEAGVISVVDFSNGDHTPIQLWKSPAGLAIGHLDWTGDGKYLACSELTGEIVVKRVNSTDWVVESVFEIMLHVSSDGIQQVLMNNDGKFMLVKNGSSVTIWRLDQTSSSEAESKSITSPNTKWVRHPTDTRLLLALSTAQVRVYLWDNFSEVAVIKLDNGLLPSTPHQGPLEDILEDMTLLSEKDAEIGSVFTSLSGSQFLIDTVSTGPGGKTHLTHFFETSAIATSLDHSNLNAIKLHPIPSEIQAQIEIPLGILPQKRLVFLDKEYWMCSWRLGANNITEKVQRYYFLPKDWLNIECLKFCALLADGKFLIPHNGELAIVKSIAMNQGLR